MIVFLSDNGWLQGEHRITGDKFLPYEESLRVPLIIRGPGVPEGPDGQGPGLQHRLRADPGRRRRRRARGGRWTASRCCRPSATRKRRPERALEIEALAPLFAGDIPVNAWDRPYTGVRTDRYTYVVWTETGEEELYDRATDPYQLDNVAGDPAYADDQGAAGREARQARGLRRQGVQREAVSWRGARALLALLVTAAAVTTATAAPAAPPRTADDLHDARYCEILVLEGAIPDARVTVWNTIGLNRCPEQWWDALDAATLADELGAGLVVLNGPRHFLMDEASGRTGQVRSFAGVRLRRVATIPI